MATSSGNSLEMTITPLLKNLSSGSDNPDLQTLMNERKRKRMQSNRESAQRSRMRKQRHLDELTAKTALLSQDNGKILNAVNLTTQRYLAVEAENTILRAQMGELANRLHSLKQILEFLSSGGPSEESGFDGLMGNQWFVDQPLMGSAEYQLYGY